MKSYKYGIEYKLTDGQWCLYKHFHKQKEAVQEFERIRKNPPVRTPEIVALRLYERRTMGFIHRNDYKKEK